MGEHDPCPTGSVDDGPKGDDRQCSVRLAEDGDSRLGGSQRSSQSDYPGDASFDSDDDADVVESYAIGGQGKVGQLFVICQQLTAF